MKTFSYTINGVQYQVDVVSIKENIAEVRVNGESYDVELDRSYDIDQEAWAAASAMPKVAPVAKAAPAAPAPQPEAAPATPAPTASASAGAGVPLKAPLPGVIVKIISKVGEAVKKGQKVMVLEAMKMENDIKADRDGVITSILVNQNQSVQDGDTLMTIE